MTPRSAWRRAPVLRFVACVLFVGSCGEPGDGLAPATDADAPVPRGAVLPGDSLLDRLAALKVERLPATNLPARVSALVRRFVRGEGWAVEPDAWQGGESMPEAAALRRELAVGGPVRRWRARAPFDLDLGLGRLWLRHEDRLLERGSVPAGATDVLFWDPEAHVLFGWEPDERQLVAYGGRAPGPVVYGYDLQDAHELRRWEPDLLGDAARAPEPSALAGRIVLGQVERTALAAPAPAELSLHVPRWMADGLTLGTAVVDLGLAVEDGRLVRAPGSGDGVVFELQVQAGAGAETVWSRWVAPGDEPVEQTVDLSRFRGRPLNLRLLTRAGPAGDDAFDYALWTELRATGTPPAPPARPHVVLIDVDTLRADRLGCYGYARDTSPRLDAWAARNATVYSDCSAPNNWTLPSTVSLLTGLSVGQHGVRAWPDRITPALGPLAQRLREAGYETRARTDGAFLGPEHGFATGFDVFDFGRRPPDEHQRVGWGPELEWLAARRSGKPVFLFLHTYQVHEPYRPDRRFDDPAAPYRGPLAGQLVTSALVRELQARDGGGLSARDEQHVNDLYDAGVRRLDDVLGAFLHGLEQVWASEPFLLVVTSDHGEELFERGGVGHGSSLHREQLAVPLLVRDPERERVGVVAQPVSALDVVPTVLDVVGLPRPPHLPGRSLARPPLDRRLRVAHHTEGAWAVAFGDGKLVTGRLDESGGASTHLYLLPDDPWERRDRALRAPQLVERLNEQLAEYEARYPRLPQPEEPSDAGEPAPSPPPELVEALRELGYVGR